MNRRIFFQILYFLFFSATVFSNEALVFSSAGTDHPLYGFAETILTEAYKKLDYSVNIRISVTRRVFMEADVGRVDGLLFGGETAASQYKNLIKVPVLLGYDEIVVFSTNAEKHIEATEDLKGYSIGILSGMKEVEDIYNPVLMMKKLEAHRNNFVVCPRSLGLQVLRELEYTDIKIVSPPLLKVGLYHFLNKRNIDILPKITALLIEYRDNGTFEKLKEKLDPMFYQ